MKALFIIFLSIITTISIASCNTKADADPKDKAVDTNPAEDLKVGGLYAFYDNEDSVYTFAKILVIDDFAVHIAMYKNEFIEIPKTLNSADLEIAIGHAPMDKNGFLQDNPVLFKVEEVKDTELEGYKYYLEAMGK